MTSQVLQEWFQTLTSLTEPAGTELDTHRSKTVATLAGLKSHGDVAKALDAIQDLKILSTESEKALKHLEIRVKENEAIATEVERLITSPASAQDAFDRCRQLNAFTDETSAHSADSALVELFSELWFYQSFPELPRFNNAGRDLLKHCFGWQPESQDPAEVYRSFCETARKIEPELTHFDSVANWFKETGACLVASPLLQLCASAEPLGERALTQYSSYIGETLRSDLSRVANRRLAPNTQIKTRDSGLEVWIEWALASNSLTVGVWINQRGLLAGLKPQPGSQHAERAKMLRLAQQRTESSDFDIYDLGTGNYGTDVGFAATSKDYVVGQWVELSDSEPLDLRNTMLTVTSKLQPLIDSLEMRGRTPDVQVENTELTALVEQFLTEELYPTSQDERHKAARIEFSEALQPNNILAIDKATFRKIYASRFGTPGVQTHLNNLIREADETEYQNVLETLAWLIWGEGSDVTRVENLLSGDRKISGLGEGVTMKLLAIAHPDRYVPIYPWGGASGKLKVLQALGITIPEGSLAQRHVESSQQIHSLLNPYFNEDTWAMSRFSRWLLDRETVAAIEHNPIETRLEELRLQTLVAQTDINEIVELLDEKGQIVFYGPPGTGKTFFARKLAEALAPGEDQRKIVQFHPSTSYEDFVEGFRPEAGESGSINYRLTPGPLVLIAEEARRQPRLDHVMVIDEINRANLAKVFGELLYLLEYRDEEISTNYRPEELFSLPPNVKFIATMNTADRSIAMIDAALRRRFHFIPFFPNEGPVAGLLGRWFGDHEQQSLWIADLIDQVNGDLIEVLGDSHLQIGPSYFMKVGLTEKKLEQIWRYNVEPLIEDQLFGRTEDIAHFQFTSVMNRYRKASEEAASAEPVDAGDGEQPSGDAGDTSD